MVSIIGVSCLVFLAAGSECSSGDVECVGQEDTVFLQLKSSNRSRMGSTLGGAQLKVKFGEFSDAVLVFADSSIHQHRSSDTEDFPAAMQEVLDQHNLYRCMHDVPLFEWDTDIEARAQSWADNGVYAHSTSDFREQEGEYCGENIAWGYRSRSGFDSTQDWYNEILDTEGGLGLTDTMNAPGGEALGHYTQIVWQGSTRLGCGVGRATATTQNLEGDFRVCQYCKGGNYQGQFAANVFSPTKTEAECAAGSSPSPSPSPSPAPSPEQSPSPSPSPSTAPTPALDFQNCVGADSVGTCEKCTHSIQCSGTSFCCPYMKLCVPSSSHGCSYPIASCMPTCSSASGSDVTSCSCSNADFPENWLP
eukprot:CAMPEP_0194549482 /NCGR_PEP_ID=MMETSP0253-20130528/95227_1 /TAXON_ID=2966 /ORGANISM="Noctiluca scintillans" /LENGTH=362 /DNA_ID=CAMNT_0039396911 /DNA_START=46 /DNA_END=1131 /DNA_ORIENTATION=-